MEKNLDNLIKAVSLLPDKVKEQVELCLIGPIADNTEKLQNLTKN